MSNPIETVDKTIEKGTQELERIQDEINTVQTEASPSINLKCMSHLMDLL
jgi:hypothetical protein